MDPTFGLTGFPFFKYLVVSGVVISFTYVSIVFFDTLGWNVGLNMEFTFDEGKVVLTTFFLPPGLKKELLILDIYTIIRYFYLKQP